MANKITYLAVEHNLLPVTQMGARKNRSTESALELLTEEVHTTYMGSGQNKSSYVAKHGCRRSVRYSIPPSTAAQYEKKKNSRVNNKLDGLLTHSLSISLVFS